MENVERRTDKDLIQKFNAFIKKWTGDSYPHLIDSDENDGERFREAIEYYASQIRQETIEECAKVVGEATMVVSFPTICPESCGCGFMHSEDQLEPADREHCVTAIRQMGGGK